MLLFDAPVSKLAFSVSLVHALPDMNADEFNQSDASKPQITAF